jgi:alanyl-tRNA synthetase
MTSREIREAFLQFFNGSGHEIVKSYPLIPRNDPSLLFTNAGMVQFKSVFLGQESRPYRTAASCQKCMRAGGKQSDLENVGHTARHHTFFEMLGNFSFGDYFKKEAIIYAWRLLTEQFMLPKSKLWVSVFEDDDEAERLWRDETDINPSRIIRLGAKDNFWQMGDTGPCGPCSEIIIDQGESLGCGRKECSVGCDCDRYLELWNLVFMQYNRDENGNLSPLPKPSIDTGMGLERISAVLQGKTNNFDTDLFNPITAAISSITGVRYGSSVEKDASIRVIADHLRASTFLISEGIVPSNEGRGYVLRRIIRRASRHARLLDVHEPCIHKMVGSVIESLGDIYPEISYERERTEKLLRIEEERFTRTIEMGMNILDEIISEVKAEGIKVIPGEEIFKLYDTYGFPFDLAKDIAIDAELSIDEAGFQREMEAQRKRARAAWSEGGEAVPSAYKDILIETGETEFVGYDSLASDSIVRAIVKNGKVVDDLNEGDKGEIILDRTPFYAESGGQVGDIGTMESPHTHLSVIDTKRPVPGLIVHHVEVKRGGISKGDTLRCHVDEVKRKDVMRNHTATHLLHRALREVLGEHVKQSGSLVSPERLRFDFTHFYGMSDAEIRKVERLVNEQITKNTPVVTEIMSVDDAIKGGAIALFDEKYGEKVRVVSIGEFSRELCGGTHSKATGEIGTFVILSEGSVAAGIRRIEAITGLTAYEYLREQSEELNALKGLLKSQTPIERVEKIISDMKLLEKEVQKLKTGAVSDLVSEALESAKEMDGFRVVTVRKENLNPKELRIFADNIRDRLGSGIIVATSIWDGQAVMLCMVTKDIKKRYNAGEIIKRLTALAGGRGGGKPEMGQGGTKEIEKLDYALAKVYDIIKETGD